MAMPRHLIRIAVLPRLSRFLHRASETHSHQMADSAEQFTIPSSRDLGRSAEDGVIRLTFSRESCYLFWRDLIY